MLQTKNRTIGKLFGGDGGICAMMLAVAASFVPKKTKAQQRREDSGREPVAKPVPKRKLDGIEANAREIAMRHARLNVDRHQKLCVNVKKLRRKLRHHERCNCDPTCWACTNVKPRIAA